MLRIQFRMIFGSISYTAISDRISKIDALLELSAAEVIIRKVVHKNFTGGYSLHARLPYTAEDCYYLDDINNILVLLSGTVYNSNELKYLNDIEDEVQVPGLIARLFFFDGPAFVKKLIGDFSILIYQTEKKKAYLFRDQVGVSPMAWTTYGNTVYFSSDIIGLCKIFSESQGIEPDFLLGSFRFVDHRKTPNRMVTKLLPGHYLCFSEKGIDIKKYWEPEKISEDRALTYDCMQDDLKSLLRDAVKIRCDKRFIAGAHLSGGLDSGVVAALARKEYEDQNEFYGFSWSPADFGRADVRYDERDLVIKACKLINISPVFSNMSISDFLQIVNAAFRNNRYFSEDHTSNQAVELKTNLILSGWGGDEFISTGDRGIEIDLLRGLKFRTFFRRNKIMRMRRFVKDMLIYVFYPVLGILDKGTARSFQNDAKYLKKKFRNNDRQAIRNFYFHRSRHQMHLRMLDFYHLQERCESWSINGYLKGVIYRYPLLDWRIIEYILKVPSELLCKTNYFRPILREITKDILPDIVRLHIFKNDPVYWASMEDLFKAAASSLMEEIDIWKKNPDLQFIDFDILAADLIKYKLDSKKNESVSLYRSLVFIKAAHEFARKYSVS